MGLSLLLRKPDARGWYTSTEALHGTVVVEESSVSKVVVYLEARLKLSTQQRAHRHLIKTNHVLFVREAVLHSSSQGEDGEASPVLCAPRTFSFELAFPDIDDDVFHNKGSCQTCQKVLPQSFRFNSGGINASVGYSLRAVAERSGIWNANRTVVRTLEFRPLLPTQPLLVDQPWRVTKPLDRDTFGPAEQIAMGDNPITFELAFPPPKVVRPGDMIDIGLNFVIPKELQHIWRQLFIFHIVVRLSTTTVASVGGGRAAKVHIDRTDACDVKGLYPLELPAAYPRVVIPPSLWNNHVYPHIVPSLRLCKLQRSHVLEVLVGFACQNTNRIQRVGTQIDVTVESGAILPSDTPPAYNAAA